MALLPLFFTNSYLRPMMDQDFWLKLGILLTLAVATLARVLG